MRSQGADGTEVTERERQRGAGLYLAGDLKSASTADARGLVPVQRDQVRRDVAQDQRLSALPPEGSHRFEGFLCVPQRGLRVAAAVLRFGEGRRGGGNVAFIGFFLKRRGCLREERARLRDVAAQRVCCGKIAQRSADVPGTCFLAALERFAQEMRAFVNLPEVHERTTGQALRFHDAALVVKFRKRFQRLSRCRERRAELIECRRKERFAEFKLRG